MVHSSRYRTRHAAFTQQERPPKKGKKSHFRTLRTDTQAYAAYDQAKELIEWADVVLMLGGLFPEQMLRLRDTGIDQLLLTAATSGEKIFTGSSTGLICWFKAAQTVEKPLSEVQTPAWYHLEPGLGLLPALVSAHYSEFNYVSGRPRCEAFRDLIKRQTVDTVSVGVSTLAALRFNDGHVDVLSRDSYSTVQRLVRNQFGFHATNLKRGHEPIPFQAFFNPETQVI